MSLYMHIYWDLNTICIVYIGSPYNKLLPINIAVTGFINGGKLNRIFFFLAGRTFYYYYYYLITLPANREPLVFIRGQ